MLKRSWALLAVCLTSVAAFGACKSDKKEAAPPSQAAAPRPTLRIFALGGPAGAVEPCGCVKDMLGGVDHMAAFVGKSRREATGALVLASGPMFFGDPEVPEARSEQARLKAEAMALSLAELGLTAFAPGENDWALGVDAFNELQKKAGAPALAANFPKEAGSVSHAEIIEVAGVKVGLTGMSIPRKSGSVLSFELQDERAALKAAQAELKKKGAEIQVALIAASRGEGLRLVESVPGFHLAILGKGFDQGEANDPPFAPTLLEKTLVVQGQNHLQGVAVVDLFVREDGYEFQDGSGLVLLEKKASLTRRIDELSLRLARAKEHGASKEDVNTRSASIERLTKERDALTPNSAPAKGSYFLYDVKLVRETDGEDPSVASRLLAYYKRVNENNREAFKDKLPLPPEEGKSSYVGVDQCSTCHQEERAVWDASRHASAYETLTKGHKEFNLDCVSCHVTGYEMPGGSNVTHVENLTDVQCETCHGPGSQHVTNPVGEGLIRRTPPKSLCSDCHHAPHVGDDWSVDEAWPKVLGPGHGR